MSKHAVSNWLSTENRRKPGSSNPFSFQNTAQNSFPSALTHPRAGLCLLCQPNMSVGLSSGVRSVCAGGTAGRSRSAAGPLLIASLWFAWPWGSRGVCILLEQSSPPGRRAGPFIQGQGVAFSQGRDLWNQAQCWVTRHSGEESCRSPSLQGGKLKLGACVQGLTDSGC